MYSLEFLKDILLERLEIRESDKLLTQTEVEIVRTLRNDRDELLKRMRSVYS
jgi:hypothetical protein